MVSSKRHDIEKGFSLIEVIVAVGIVSFAFVGIMAIFASNIRVEIANRDRITASYLAQEGVEVIRQIRDNSWREGKAYDADIPTGENQTLSLNDPDNLTRGWEVSASGALNKQKIYLTDAGTYIQTKNESYVATHPSLRETTFRRVVKIEKDLADATRMIVTVYYGTSGSKVEIVSYVFNNWYNG